MGSRVETQPGTGWRGLGGDGSPVPPPPPPPGPREPIRVSIGVQSARLIQKVDPIYPELSKRARVSGVVLLQVTLDERGLVTGVKLIRGHPLLNQSAIDAVSQLRYSPTLLSGEPRPGHRHRDREFRPQIGSVREVRGIHSVGVFGASYARDRGMPGVFRGRATKFSAPEIAA